MHLFGFTIETEVCEVIVQQRGRELRLYKDFKRGVLYIKYWGMQCVFT